MVKPTPAALWKVNTKKGAAALFDGNGFPFDIRAAVLIGDIRFTLLIGAAAPLCEIE